MKHRKKESPMRFTEDCPPFKHKNPLPLFDTQSRTIMGPFVQYELHLQFLWLNASYSFQCPESPPCPMLHAHNCKYTYQSVFSKRCRNLLTSRQTSKSSRPALPVQLCIQSCTSEQGFHAQVHVEKERPWFQVVTKWRSPVATQKMSCVLVKGSHQQMK